MVDLVDYLRDKLEHAEDVVCTCPDVDISTVADYPGHRVTTKGWDRGCPIDGVNGIKPIMREVNSATGEVMVYQNSRGAIDTGAFRDTAAYFGMLANPPTEKELLEMPQHEFLALKRAEERIHPATEAWLAQPWATGGAVPAYPPSPTKRRWPWQRA